MEKKRKKRKLKVGRLFLLLLIIVAISFLCVKFIDVPIRSIVIEGNEILSDKEVIEQAKLEDYPSYFAVISLVVKSRIKKNPYVEEAWVKKGILSIKIKVKEKKILYVKEETNEKVTLTGSIKDEKQVCVPYLIGTIPEKKQTRFIKSMNKIDSNILCQMSQIKYEPNEIDNDRYYVFMNDGNTVYLTVNKFDKLNKYNTILENIGKQNGILYLDYGDYFEVK